MSQKQNRIDVLEPEIPLSMFENDNKVSYSQYQNEIRSEIAGNANTNDEQNENCDCENGSEFMADMPTNESYSISEENERGNDDQAIKFLTETGMLTKLDGRVHFDLN